jgi:hypothetical protein
MIMLNSVPFGPFDPLKPGNLPGPLAKIIFADPIEIDAPISTVWEIMTGFDRYPQWNPMNRFFKLDGKASPGEGVTFGPSWGPYEGDNGQPLPKHDFVNRESITVWEVNCCLAYADIRRHMAAERVQYLSQLSNGKTRYHTYERTSGLFSPLMRIAFAKKIYLGFTANGIALKRRAEAFASGGSTLLSPD